MRDLFAVAKFTILDMVKRKAFWVTNIIIFLFIILAFNIPNIISSINSDDSKSKSLVVDVNNIFEGNLNSLNEMGLSYDFIIENKAISLKEVKKKINDGDVSEAIIIEKSEDGFNIKYVTDNIAFFDSVPPELVSVFSSLYNELQLSKLDITEEEYRNLHPVIGSELIEASEKEVKGNILVMMFSSIGLFFAIYFFALKVSNSITIEKTSKIIETLVTSTKPKYIVLGKTLGVGLVGILQLLGIIIVGLISYKLFMPAGALDSLIDLSTINLKLGILVIVYFILGYALYSMLYALTGSTVNKPEDVATANGPISLIAVAGFYLAYFTLMNPTSAINEYAALIPISSPFCMPSRIMMDVATTKEIILSLGILVATIALIAFISIKVYSIAILNTGSKPSIKDMIKMIKRNEG